MIKCKKCQSELPDTYRYCIYCSAKLPKTEQNVKQKEKIPIPALNICLGAAAVVLIAAVAVACFILF